MGESARPHHGQPACPVFVTETCDSFSATLENKRATIPDEVLVSSSTDESTGCINGTVDNEVEKFDGVCVPNSWASWTPASESLFPDAIYPNVLAANCELSSFGISAELSFNAESFPGILENGSTSGGHSLSLFDSLTRTEDNGTGTPHLPPTSVAADKQHLARSNICSVGGLEVFAGNVCDFPSGLAQPSSQPSCSNAVEHKREETEECHHAHAASKNVSQPNSEKEQFRASSGDEFAHTVGEHGGNNPILEDGDLGNSDNADLNHNGDITGDSSSSFFLWDDESRCQSPSGSRRHRQSKVFQKPPTTLNISLENLKEVFHLHRPEAERHLNLKRTTFSNLSRYYGISKWPFRTLRDADKRITHNRELLQRPSTSREKRRKLEIQQRRLRAVKDLMYSEPHQSKDSNTLSVLLSLVAARENRRRH